MQVLSRVLPAALAALLLLTAAARAEETTKKSVSLNIDAQPLRDALNAFAQQSGLQIVFYTNVSEGLMSGRLSGTYKPEAALSRLLANTPLAYEFINPRMIAIRVQDKKASSAGAGLASSQMKLSLAAVGLVDADDKDRNIKAKKSSRDSETEVVVEDTRIKPYSDANADIPRTVNDAQPYYIFDSRTIEQSGAITVEDFILKNVTMNNQRSTNSTNTTSYGTNSQLNLRGLGADRTLILVNGRRVPATTMLSSDTQPDINGIAPSMIDRIEVLPTSGSGIYGGNALGGVINIVLKDNYRGGEVRANYANTWDGDAARRSLAASYGFGLEGGRTQLSLSAQYSDGNAIRMADRADIVQKYYERARMNNPAHLSSPSTPFVGATTNLTNAVDAPLELDSGGVLPSRFTYVPYGLSATTSDQQRDAALVANAGSYNYDLPNIYWLQQGLGNYFGFTPTITSVSASVSRKMTSRIEAYLDYSFSRNEGKSLYSSYFNSARTVDADAPTNPFTTDVLVRMPAERLKPRIGIFDRTTIMTGLKASLPMNWTAMLDFSHAENENSHRYESVNNTAINNALRDGILNPFVDTNLYPVSLDPYASTSELKHAARQDSLSLRMSGPFLALPWGRTMLTVALENRITGTRNGSSYSLSPQAPASESLRTYFGFKQVITSAYVETLVPLVATGRVPGVHSLELQLAGRGDKYRLGTGTSTMTENLLTGTISYGGQLKDGQPFRDTQEFDDVSPTVGLKYQPVESVTLRTSYSTGFQPPLNSQLQVNLEPSTTPIDLIDPLTGLPVDGGVLTIGGGNADIKPQNSTSFTAGIIWEPRAGVFNNLRVNAEYYSIAQDDAIANLSAQIVANLYPNRTIRDNTGKITMVNVSSLNLYNRKMRGWDFTVNYLLHTSRAGDFTFRGTRSLILSSKTQFSLGTPSYEGAGWPLDTGNGGALKHQTNLNLSWDRGNWSASWTARVLSSYHTYGAAGGPLSLQYGGGANYGTYADALGNNGIVPGQDFHDMVVGYRFAQTNAGGGLAGITDNMSVMLGVRNVFNTAPEFDPGPFMLGYLSPFADVRMREVWMTVRRGF